MPKNPTLSFRSSELIENYIAKEMKKDTTLTRSEIAKALMEKAIKETPVLYSHSTLDITGVLIPCPRQKYPVQIGNREAYHQPLVDTSVCESCPKKTL